MDKETILRRIKGTWGWGGEMLSIYLFSGYYAIIEQHVNQRQNYTYVEKVFLFSIVVFKRCSVSLN